MINFKKLLSNQPYSTDIYDKIREVKEELQGRGINFIQKKCPSIKTAIGYYGYLKNLSEPRKFKFESQLASTESCDIRSNR